MVLVLALVRRTKDNGDKVENMSSYIQRWSPLAILPARKNIRFGN